MDQRSLDDNEREVVNYVPDEVCVVVSVDGVDNGAALYEHVRGRLNGRLATLLREADRDKPSDSWSPLARDLYPQRLLERFREDASPLQRLRRPGIQVREPPRASVVSEPARQARPIPPWMSLRREAPGRSTWQLVYQLGKERVSLDPGQLEQRQQRLQSIRELVLLLNVRSTGEVIDRFRGQPWSIRSLAPNWLTAAMPFSCGSPSGVPLAASPAQPPHVTFPHPAVQAVLRRRRRRPVVVAALDTCPEQVTVDNAARRFNRNPLLRSVQSAVRMNEPALVPDAYFGHLTDCLPRVQWDMQSGPAAQHPEQFRMADHGLFALGLIYDVVGRGSELHLIRVLNEYGIGDVVAINHALAALPRALLGSDTPPPGGPLLVVNLSLGSDVPIPARLLERWLPNVARDAGRLAASLPEICTLLDQLHGNLADVTTWLAERGVLVIAAAGNDALRRDVTPAEPPPPRYPARYDDVLGVAAMRRDLRSAAVYSNRGDTVVQAGSGHISTFGGNVQPPPSDAAPATTDPEDSIVGIYSGDLPLGVANATGWAKWSGTSFSTPIIAGLAARLWATEPTLSPQQVAGTLRGFAQHPHGGANPDAPLQVPVLPVQQA